MRSCCCRKTTGALKIVHERYDRKKNEVQAEDYKVGARGWADTQKIEPALEGSCKW
jgi:hypothetical protein